MYLFLILLIPLCWVIVSKFVWHNTITVAEAAWNFGVTVLVTVTVYAAGSYVSLRDTATITGSVVAKEKNRVSCRHSYSCNCRQSCSGSGQNRSCYTTCDTCYDHSYDIDWDVQSNIGSLSIDTIDRQGLKEPPRWSNVKVGEPFTGTVGYINYIKAAPDSLFTALSAGKYLDKVPDYPQSVYDYYRMNRFVVVGHTGVSVNEWNTGISNILKTLGPAKQANIVFVLTNIDDQKYADALAHKWLGGKKNDIVIVIGSKTYPTVDWVCILTWSKNSIFQIKLRDSILDRKVLDPISTLKDVEEIVRLYYVRKPFSEFKYLEDELEPPTWLIILSLIISVLSTSILTLVFHRNNIYRRIK